jgi:hypothetical protein
LRRVIYRDRKTGRWVKESTWRRSKAHGGTRYRREFIRPPKPPKKPPRKPMEAAPPPLPEPVFEWVVAFTYLETGRSFDVIVTARDEQRAYRFAKEFLRADKEGKKIARVLPSPESVSQELLETGEFERSGWQIVVPRGQPTDEEEGEAEYRNETKK